ncbi:PREDICTED: uncharacterized protein LOC104602153 isoform X2 [Nelumbo nucifera]|uniref:Uncharacterized protein LOC104602153 isoform X2 n=1 Tax=Nelumbo nucifera TaxID=4432 RepID=A0A1U8ANG4_NELNU|nr:PREDICTED: uncharacterized protein LOC104602153 isoform X2 [Nelumbo nucifera]
MKTDAPGPSGQRIQQESASVVLGDGFHPGKRAHNVSVQTGEEFSLEFLQDRAASRRVPMIPDIDQGHSRRGGFNCNQNNQMRYEDLTGILGFRRMDSECGVDVSHFAMGKDQAAEIDKIENSGNFDKARRYHMEASASVKGLRLYSDEMDRERAAQLPSIRPISISKSSHFYQPNLLGVSDGSKPGKMKFLCSFGGRILPRPSDGKLRYVGGETRIITIRKNLSWEELVKKTSAICNQPHMIKYQLPGEDLDSLISVSSDEDLLNMIEEYYGFEGVEGSQRLRIFLISSSESEGQCSCEAMTSQQSNSEYQYVVAVNGILDRSPLKSSSGQTLVNQLGHSLDTNPSFHRDSPSFHPLEIKDGINSSNLVGVFSHPSAPFFMAHNHDIDSKNYQMQLPEDQFCLSSNENSSPFFTDQSPLDNCCIDTTGYYHPLQGPIQLMNHHHPNKHVMDVDQTQKPRGVHFHNRRPSRDFSLAFVRNVSDMEGHSRERPMLKEKAFHSEKFLSHLEDKINTLSGSNDSIGSHHGLPHARSDSQLQEHGGRSAHGLQEGATSSSPSAVAHSSSWLNSSALHERPEQFQENADFPNPKFPSMLRDTQSIVHQRRLDLSNSSHYPEFSGRIESHLEDDSVGSHHGLPHARSDSQLQEHGGRSPLCLQEGATSSSPFAVTHSSSWLNSSALHERPEQSQENADFLNSKLPSTLRDTQSIAHQRRLDLSNSSHYPEFSGRIESHLEDHDFDGKCQMTKGLNDPNFMLRECYEENPRFPCEMFTLTNEKDSHLPQDAKQYESNINTIPHATDMEHRDKLQNIDQHQGPPASFFISSEPCSDIKGEHHKVYQPDRSTSDFLVNNHIVSKDQHCTMTKVVNDGIEDVKSVLPCTSSIPWSRAAEVADFEKSIHHNAKQHSNDDVSLTDLLSSSSNCPVSYASPELIPVSSQRGMGDQPEMVTTSVLTPIAVADATDQILNSQTTEPQNSWSLFHNPATDGVFRRELSLPDEDPVNYIEYKVEKLGPVGHSYKVSKVEDASLFQSEPLDNLHEKIQLEPVVIVEDVTVNMPPAIQSHSMVVPIVNEGFEDNPSSRATDADSMSPDSEYNDSKSDDRDMDASISDAAMAEIEAGIYGLQIIKNADLEELRELGSGTFGTVYHGKWRGTDVAIKRIKKSCFAGRLSEQEQLTKDFWREAKILSNLHHPNVVAFYGVVPDGAEGTLATVTEFMVNGSLRHVLLKKDKMCSAGHLIVVKGL